jgi:Zn-dependent protease with chaperone function
MSSLDFSYQEVERASRYHRPRYYLLFVRTALTVGVALALRAVDPNLDGAGWAGAAALWAVVLVVALDVVSLPLDVWQGYVRERAWGFSTQTLRGWAVDHLKGLAISVVLAAAAWTSLVGVARAWPSWWVVPAAVGAALVVLFLLFVAPVVLEPVFNSFRPLEDAGLAQRLSALAERVGAPVRTVLVADASRRTNKVNAYVSGLGASRRVVVWDTLLEAADPDGIALVVAHELGHRKLRHVAKLTAASMAAAVAVVIALRLVLPTPRAHDLPGAVIVLVVAQAALLPLLSALSRRFERQADLFALRATGELTTFERVMTTLARRNLGDLAPPRWAYLLLFSHPTAPERLALARASA